MNDHDRAVFRHLWATVHALACHPGPPWSCTFLICHQARDILGVDRPGDGVAP